jgi:hypothetical protein
MSTTLHDWLSNGWLRKHGPTRKEIADLFAIVDRDLKDSRAPGVSSDWSFGIAYNAALKLCAILLHATGYRPEKTLQHYRTLQALPLILGDHWKSEAEYLETCRRKRNVVEYDRVGDASETDARELQDFIGDFRVAVTDWLRENHPELLQ